MSAPSSLYSRRKATNGFMMSLCVVAAGIAFFRRSPVTC